MTILGALRQVFEAFDEYLRALARDLEARGEKRWLQTYAQGFQDGRQMEAEKREPAYGQHCARCWTRPVGSE